MTLCDTCFKARGESAEEYLIRPFVAKCDACGTEDGDVRDYHAVPDVSGPVTLVESPPELNALFGGPDAQD